MEDNESSCGEQRVAEDPRARWCFLQSRRRDGNDRAARSEQLGKATRPSTTRPPNGHSRHGTCLMLPAHAREGAQKKSSFGNTRLHQTRRPVNQTQACLRREVTMRHGATRSGDNSGVRAPGRALTGVSLLQAMVGCTPKRQGSSLRQPQGSYGLACLILWCHTDHDARSQPRTGNRTR